MLNLELQKSNYLKFPLKYTNTRIFNCDGTVVPVRFQVEPAEPAPVRDLVFTDYPQQNLSNIQPYPSFIEGTPGYAELSPYPLCRNQHFPYYNSPLYLC